MSSSDSPRASSPDETPLSNDESLQNLEAGLGALALEKCRSDEDTELLDAIDNLRSQGLREHISLPQLIVCGNQSSGKSSVLEAISGVPFPSSDNTCTRFPTEVILRRHEIPLIQVTIIPSTLTNSSPSKKITEFEESLTSFDEFPDLIQKAKEAMGISSGSTTFSNDILRVEISGPDRTPLTLVDLPGLFHSEQKAYGGGSRKHVHKLTESYMEDKRSIILTVVSASEDIVMEVVTGLAGIYDPERKRTIGIITKPDTLPAGSDKERFYFELAHNRETPKLELGWHVLRNRDYATRNASSQQRDENEALFFSEGIWAGANKDLVGIAALNPHLSDILLDNIKNELPKILRELREKIAECKAEIRKLGDARETLSAQRDYLRKASLAFHSIVRAAVDGVYNNHFFGDIIAGQGHDKLLRAQIDKAQRKFAADMIKRGNLHQIVDDDGYTSNSPSDEVSGVIKRADFLDHVAELLERYRGRELPGMFNPLIVGELFREHASPWKEIIAEHQQRAQKAATTFLKLAIAEVIPASVLNPLWELVFAPFLTELDDELKKTSQSLLNASYSLHPITLNDAFTQAIQAKRTERYRHLVMKACFPLENPSLGYLSTPQSVKPEVVIDALVNALVINHKSDMNGFACSEILDYMEAYYEIALKRMIDNVAGQVVEEALIQKLGNVFSQDCVYEMEPELVRKIAGESAQVRALRSNLTQKLKLLEEALRICSPYQNRTPIEDLDS